VRLLARRRRRVRLLMVCVATAAACAVVAGAVVPDMLIGGVAPIVESPAPAKAGPVQASRPVPGGPLGLAERLRLDPREVQVNSVRWAAMTLDQRRAMLDRYWRLAEIDPVARQRLVDAYASFRDLSEKRQEFLRTRARRLQEFIRTLSPQDQALLESMGDEQRARHLVELWKARYGSW